MSYSSTVVWSDTPSYSSIVSAGLPGTGGGTTLPSQSGNSGKVLGTDGSALSWVATSGTGTVTQVSSGNLSPLFTVSIANATATPTFTFTAVSQSKNVVYAGPSSGSNAAPTFRSLVAADVPDLSGTYLTNAGNLGGLASATTARNNLGLGQSNDVTFNSISTTSGLSGFGSFGAVTGTTYTGVTFNGLTLTSSTGTITITNGKTLSVANTVTITGTDGSTLGIGSGVSLSAFAGLSLVADRLPYANGTGTLTLATFTAAGRALLDDADAAAQRTTLGLGTANSPTFAGVTINGTVTVQNTAGDTNVLTVSESGITTTGVNITVGSGGKVTADTFVGALTGNASTASGVAFGGVTGLTKGFLLGRGSASDGAAEQITLGSGLSLSGTTLTGTGGGTTALAGLTTDVSLSSVARGDIFVRGASMWNNRADAISIPGLSYVGRRYQSASDLDVGFIRCESHVFNPLIGTPSIHGSGFENCFTARGIGYNAVNASGRWLKDGATSGFNPRSVLSCWIYVPVLSASGNDFRFVFGLTEEWRYGGAGSHGIWIEYDRSGNGDQNFRLVTRASGTSTKTNTSIGVNAERWYHIAILMDSTSSIRCAIDGTVRATNTTNIPTQSDIAANCWLLLGNFNISGAEQSVKVSCPNHYQEV